MLDLEDFGSNPHAPEFGDRGVLYVRWGKASKGSAPKRRSVLTVFPWSVRVLDEWLGTYRELFESARSSSALWPSERSDRLGMMPLGARFAEWRDALGLPEEVGMHALRHSYVTHLIEDGYDPLFVQQQVGHSYASTTALYTSVSSARSASPSTAPSLVRSLRRRKENRDGSPTAQLPLAPPTPDGRPRPVEDHPARSPPAGARHRVVRDQVYRLVAEKPGRLSMRTLAALCDIFECSPADLIEPYVEASGRAKKVEGAGVVDIHPNFRPVRARILDE